MADRARLGVFEFVETPFARADIEEAVLYGVACLLVRVTSQWSAAVAISCGRWWQNDAVVEILQARLGAALSIDGFRDREAT